MRIIKDSEIDAMPLVSQAKAHADNAVEYARRAVIASKVAVAFLVIAIVAYIVQAVR